MKMNWKSFLLATLGVVAVSAQAQELYTSTRTINDQSISLTGWGNGLIAEAEEVPYEGTGSLRFSTRNFFQGGIIRFGSAVDLSSAFTNRANLLHFTVNIPSGGGSAGGGRGPAGGRGLGGPGGLAGGGSQGTGELGGLGGGPASAQTASALKTVRMVITTTDGLRSEAFLDLSTPVADERGWFSVGIPLQAINGFERTNKAIQSIALAGDAVSTYYVGSIKIINDTTPVFAEPNVRELNLAFGDQVTFAAAGSAGATPVKFQWDFDSRDGITVDVEGQTVVHRFRNPGEFEVTLTAIDIYGLKQPYTTKIKVIVNP